MPYSKKYYMRINELLKNYEYYCFEQHDKYFCVNLTNSLFYEIDEAAYEILTVIKKPFSMNYLRCMQKKYDNKIIDEIINEFVEQFDSSNEKQRHEITSSHFSFESLQIIIDETLPSEDNIYRIMDIFLKNRNKDRYIPHIILSFENIFHNIEVPFSLLNQIKGQCNEYKCIPRFILALNYESINEDIIRYIQKYNIHCRIIITDDIMFQHSHDNRTCYLKKISEDSGNKILVEAVLRSDSNLDSMIEYLKGHNIYSAFIYYDFINGKKNHNDYINELKQYAKRWVESRIENKIQFEILNFREIVDELLKSTENYNTIGKNMPGNRLITDAKGNYYSSYYGYLLNDIIGSISTGLTYTTLNTTFEEQYCSSCWSEKYCHRANYIHSRQNNLSNIKCDLTKALYEIGIFIQTQYHFHNKENKPRIQSGRRPSYLIAGKYQIIKII